jgi:cytochrome c553
MSLKWYSYFGLMALTMMPPVARGETPSNFDAASLEFFEKRIRPLLVDNCHTCHSADTNSKGGLRVDDRNGLIYGGQRGAAIVPGNPDESLLLRAVGYADEDLKMPPDKQLSAEQVADLRQWIKDGAAWPPVELPSDLGQSNSQYEALRKRHWAWQPLVQAAPPAVRDAAWPKAELDTFVLARLEETGIAPVGDADRTTLIRRLTFDLTGLPPTPADVAAFLGDTSTDALEKAVDRLLASPAFGEHWGRHWLDVARYGESTGSSRNIPFPHAWRYRDYVINAFNQDKPYDEFIREQIAGDLLPSSSQQQRDERQIATGFLALGVKDVNQRFKVRFVMDNIDEQIDTVSRSVLALTASCARCHDHKFDPIPTTDYYALAGIFHSTDLCAGVRNKMGGGGLDYYDTQALVRLGSAESSTQPTAESAKKIEDLTKAVDTARTEFQALRDKPEGNEPGSDGRPKRAIARQKWNKLQLELQGLTDPAASGAPVAFGVRDSHAIADTEVRIRGEAEQLGPRVPRGFLSVLPVPGQQAIEPKQSGRLQLAKWLTSADNPLTSRVIVNRAWHHLFGRGLVSSVDNFGINGDTPTHLELLDHLAIGFVRDGWSIKRLVRSIVLSRVYGLAASAEADRLAVDPANRLVWRHAPRRLTAEELRDTTLAVAGSLDLGKPPAAAVKDFKVVELRNNGPEARQLAQLVLKDRHRSVYLPLLRGLTPRPLEVFDFAEQGMVTGSRDATTVAMQALYLLNDPFVRQQSLELANQLLARTDCDDTERVHLAYRLTLGRAAHAIEVERGLRFLNDYAASLPATPSNPPAQPEADIVATAEPTPPAEGNGGNASAETAGTKKKKATPANPDEADQTDEPLSEEQVVPASPQSAAWASFCQALFASAEFRYLQ